MFEKGSHGSWLVSCPAADGNFKTHLKQASVSELNDVYNALPDEGNKSKKKVILQEIKKRQNGGEKNDNQGL